MRTTGVRPLAFRVVAPAVRRGTPEFPAGSDPELGEDLAEMPLHRPGTDVQDRADLRVGVPLRSQPGDVGLLSGELTSGHPRALAHCLPGGQEFPAGPLGEPLDAHGDQCLVGGPQLGARVDAATLPPQPLAVEELCSGELDVDRGAGEPVDGLPVEPLGAAVSAQEGAPARLHPECPVSTADACRRGKGLECRGSCLHVPTARSGLDEFGERPGGRTVAQGIGGRRPSR